jgi:hypothetical protein
MYEQKPADTDKTRKMITVEKKNLTFCFRVFRKNKNMMITSFPWVFVSSLPKTLFNRRRNHFSIADVQSFSARQSSIKKTLRVFFSFKYLKKLTSSRVYYEHADNRVVSQPYQGEEKRGDNYGNNSVEVIIHSANTF